MGDVGTFGVYVLMAVVFLLPWGSLAALGTDNTTCGIQTATLKPESRIINGNAAQEGEWPWQAAFIFLNRTICGGSLIHPEWILTAAHCLLTVTKHPELYQFRMGTNNLLDNSENMQQRRAVAMYMHPDYKINGGDPQNANVSNDVALFKLDSPFNITDYVRTVCLPQKDMVDFSNDTVVTVTGWGQTENGTANIDELLEVTLFLQDQTSCAETWLSTNEGVGIDDTMICAGKPGETPTKSACFGDSGGPLVLQFEGKWTQLGVVSFGPSGCNSTEIPNVYARVTTFLDWIEPIFNGSEPEGQDRECTDTEYRCSLGGCIYRQSKCDGFNDCYATNDEDYCDSLAIIFDPYYDVRLSNTSVISQIAVKSAEECAQKCIETEGYGCHSFDVIGNGTHWTCAMAGPDFKVIATSPLISEGQISEYDKVTHFELDPGIDGLTHNYSKHLGFIASPKVFGQQFLGPDSGIYPQFIKPNGGVNMITLTFAGILAEESEGMHDGPEETCLSYIVIQAFDKNDEFLKKLSFCLYKLKTANVLAVEGWRFQLEFHTSNVTENRFVASYKAEWRCNDTIIVENAGLLSSPLYPDMAYPKFVNCLTLLVAPTGNQVALQWEDFSQDICMLGHNVKIFDGYEEKLDKLVTSCSTYAPQPHEKIVSTMGALLVSFVTNANANMPGEGFNIIYYTEESLPSTESTPPKSTSSPVMTDKDPVHQQLTVYKNALIGVSVGAGILLIVLIFYVMYLNDEKDNMTKAMEDPQPKKGVYNSKKEHDYEMADDPGIGGNANAGFDAI